MNDENPHPTQSDLWEHGSTLRTFEQNTVEGSSTTKSSTKTPILDTIALACGLVEQMQTRETDEILFPRIDTSSASSPTQCAPRSLSEGKEMESTASDLTSTSTAQDQQENYDAAENYTKHIHTLEECLEIYALLLERIIKLPTTAAGAELYQDLAKVEKPIHYLIHNRPGTMDDTTMTERERMRELCIDVLEHLTGKVLRVERMIQQQNIPDNIPDVVADGSAECNSNDLPDEEEEAQSSRTEDEAVERLDGGVSLYTSSNIAKGLSQES